MSARGRWPFVRRLVDLSRWAISMFEEKRDNGQRRLSMVRVSVAAFTAAYVIRLLALETPLGWPDAVLAFAVLFALPIGKALDRAPPETVVKAVTGMFGRRERPPREDPEAYGGPSPGYAPPAFIDASPDYIRPDEDEEP